MAKKRISLKQKKFVKEYLATGNATEAAARSYDVKSRSVANAVGNENLSKPSIQAMIEAAAEGAFAQIQILSETAEAEPVRLNASKDILDRAGFKPVERQDLNIKSVSLTDLFNGVIDGTS